MFPRAAFLLVLTAVGGCGGEVRPVTGEGYLLLSVEARDAGYSLREGIRDVDARLPRPFREGTKVEVLTPDGTRSEVALREAELTVVLGDGSAVRYRPGVDVRDDALFVTGDSVAVEAVRAALGAEAQPWTKRSFLVETAHIYEDIASVGEPSVKGAAPVPLVVNAPEPLAEPGEPAVPNRRLEDAVLGGGATPPALDEKDTLCLYDAQPRLIPFARYRAHLPRGVRVGRADRAGEATFKRAELPRELFIEWSGPTATDPSSYEFQTTLDLPPDDASPFELASANLNNLGFNFGAFEDRLMAFKRELGQFMVPPLPVDGVLTERTRALLEYLGDSCEPDLAHPRIPKSIRFMRARP